ncbi:hypothetical protein GOP47_0006412 [Adiantum capillus-veneris]|uniref:Heat shock 70 kDa protein 8 n=1 Tax=Adiantum capillus-veneris TaxID=13818 RepID=A0A9D4V3J4_ADICA|nr:hypothetical protein GOP47_0006412 [Adiantum capillus-veneris]
MAEQSGYTVASDGENNPVEESQSSLSPLQTAVGIDLGSRFCSVAVWRDSKVEVLSNPRSLRRMPSHVLFKSDIPCSGVSAPISDVELYSGTAIYRAKCLLGRADTDQVVQTCKNCPFLVQTLDIGARPFLAALVDGVWRSTTPEEVLAIVLVELRAMAEAHLGHTVRSAVLTMPASFSRFQQTRLERACAMAGLHVLRLMPEPTAVALLYAQEQQKALHGNMGSGIEKNVLIFNAGAGFCDVAIAATAGGVSQIRAVAGDSIGGDAMVQNLVNHVLNEYASSVEGKSGPPFSKLSAQVVPVAEKVMHALSTSASAVLECEIHERRISRSITREEFERINEDILKRCEALVMQCLQQGQTIVDSLDDVILVGGVSNVPAIRSLVLKACGGKQAYKGFNPLEAAVQGAAMEGAIASGLTDSSGRLDLLTIQAMPHSVGIRVSGDEFLPVLQKNGAIPARRDIVVTTSYDKQTEALIIVYEGESRQASENHLLGFFKLTGIPPAPKGTPLISLCMDVDASDVLRVVVGVCMPGVEKPVLPLVEVRMPTIDDGHGWCTDAIRSKYGLLLELDVLPLPKPPGPSA